MTNAIDSELAALIDALDPASPHGVVAVQARLAAVRLRAEAAKLSPFAPAELADLPPIDGVRLSARACGVRYQNRLDVMLAEIAPGAAVAGVFTRSSTRAAPVLWCQERVAAHQAAPTDGPIAILVNAGNANAFTGAQGKVSVDATVAAVAQAVGAPSENIYVASTGVIGESLPHERITGEIGALAEDLAADAWPNAAQAIMTTDTFPKVATAMVEIDGVPVNINGFAKGSGMIAPDMATMLAFVFTDAVIAPKALQEMLAPAADATFNSITVDSDTSTSDTLMLAATRRAGHGEITDANDPRAAAFRAALEDVCRDLAQQIVKDGEGATKFVEVRVTGAANATDARRAGLAIADSPLVKTAFAGEDPNWGRIVAAVGKSGAQADRDRLSIWFGDILVAEKGWVAASYREDDGAAYMKQAELVVTVDLGVGDASGRVWTCDLTKRYIEINADYRS